MISELRFTSRLMPGFSLGGDWIMIYGCRGDDEGEAEYEPAPTVTEADETNDRR